MITDSQTFSYTLQEWSDGLTFCVDEDGKEQLIDSDGVQVMMEWERPYMEQCVEALSIDGECDVLEVGFGTGYSAEHIQRAGPKSHTIIECSKSVLERLRPWAADKPNVRVIEGTWQRRLPELGLFDKIFFDDYARLGREEREMKHCPRPEYTDVYNNSEQHFNAFLKIALQWHAREGTLLSGYMASSCYTWELSPQTVKWKFWYTPVMPSRHCNYFFSDKATVPLFEKKAFRAQVKSFKGRYSPHKWKMARRRLGASRRTLRQKMLGSSQSVEPLIV